MNDHSINPTSIIPSGPQPKVNPAFLIKIMPEPGSKVKVCSLFIATNKPDYLAGHVEAKGFFSSASEADIVSAYRDIIESTNLSDMVSLHLPWHSIYEVRSLVFKPNNK